MTRIIAVMLAVTLPLCAFAQDAEAPVAQDQQVEGEAQAIFARAHWPGQDLSNTFYRVFADEGMRDLVDVFRAGGPDGGALLVLRPGTYWIMAVVDVGGTDRPDPGDGIGFYGVNEISAQARPSPLEVGDEAVRIMIPILVRLNDEMRMEPLPWTQAHQSGTVTGTIVGLDGRAGVVALLPLMDDETAFAAPVDADGEFSLEAAPGSYRLVAAVDADGDCRLSEADPVGIAGSAEEPITVEADAETALDAIGLSAGTVPEAVPPLIAGQITGAEAPEGAKLTVAFCTDAAMREQSFAVQALADGRFAAVVEPGTYYLRATVDLAGDGTLGAGDMLGFYGVTDLMSEERPAALEVGEDALLTEVIIPISARMDEDGRLSAWRGEAAPAEDAPETEAENAPGE